MDAQRWAGRWVADRLGIALELDGTGAQPPPERVGLALRRRSTRPYLLVSGLLGKHVPVDPRVADRAGRRLGAQVGAVLDARPAVVLGYAETATGLGHCVADELGAACLHSTRRVVAGSRPVTGFEEAHSHAPGHLLLPEDPDLLGKPEPVVLVDDELSTGRTALNTIRALHRICPRDDYVVAALLDVRAADDRALMRATAAELGTRISVVAGAAGRVRVPADASDLAARLLAAYARPPAVPEPRARVRTVDGGWPAGLREGARHGYRAADRQRAGAAAEGVAARLAGHLAGERVLVLGCEELMHAPLLIAAALADRAPAGRTVRFAATTRSPVVAIDEVGYAIRTALAFPAHDLPGGGTGERFVYNVVPPRGAQPYTDVVLVVDEVADTPALWATGGLVEQLAGACERAFVVTLPTHLPR